MVIRMAPLIATPIGVALIDCSSLSLFNGEELICEV